MSDDKKTGTDLASDPAPNPPLKDPQVDVKVRPKQDTVPKPGNAPREQIDKVKRRNEENKNLAEKVKKNLTDEVKKAVEKAAPNGAADQFQAAKEAGEEAARQISGRKIKKIEINVGEKGGNREQTTEHLPKEGGDPE